MAESVQDSVNDLVVFGPMANISIHVNCFPAQSRKYRHFDISTTFCHIVSNTNILNFITTLLLFFIQNLRSLKPWRQSTYRKFP